MRTDEYILLVDDDEIDIMTMQRALEQTSFLNPVKVAKNGEAGIKILETEQHPPGLAIIDINMPRMNGINLLQAMKSNNKWKTIPTIMLSSSKEYSDIQKCMELGVSGYMVKPNDFNAFKAMVTTIKNYWYLNESIKG